MMNLERVAITIHLGEPFWRTVGQRELAIAVADGATVADVVRALAARYPALAADLQNGEAKSIIFVNDEQTAPDSRVVHGAKIHVVWPVSGG